MKLKDGRESCFSISGLDKTPTKSRTVSSTTFLDASILFEPSMISDELEYCPNFKTTNGQQTSFRQLKRGVLAIGGKRAGDRARVSLWLP